MAQTPAWELDDFKPVLAAHAAVTAGRQAAAVALREVLRELYPAALRAYPDPAERVPLKILDALPEPGMLSTAPSAGNRDASLVAELSATGDRRSHDGRGRDHSPAGGRAGITAPQRASHARSGRGRDRPPGRRRGARVRRRIRRPRRHVGGAARIGEPGRRTAAAAPGASGSGLTGATPRVRTRGRGAGQSSRAPRAHP